MNISKRGMAKDQHGHNSKWEFFTVVSGHGFIPERKTGTDKMMGLAAPGEKLEAAHPDTFEEQVPRPSGD